MQIYYCHTLLIGLSLVGLTACESGPTHVSTSKTTIITTANTPTVTEVPPLNTPPTVVTVQPTLKVTTILQPLTYTHWLNEGQNKQQLEHYKNYLKQHEINFIVPDFQMLRSARNWQQCNYVEYEVPPQDVWENAIPTLKLLKKLKDDHIIDDNIEVTSSYRSPFLNACAGGAKNSSHVKNSAIDFRIGPENPNPEDEVHIHQTKVALCKFWQTQGKFYNMGIGIYESGQIHIDTLNYRTWGYNHSWRTSLCGEIIP